MTMMKEIKILFISIYIPTCHLLQLSTFHKSWDVLCGIFISRTLLFLWMTLVTLPTLFWHIWFPSSLTLRMSPSQTAETGNGYLMWKRNLFEGPGEAHRIRRSCRDLTELITVLGQIKSSMPVLPSRSQSLERKSNLAGVHTLLLARGSGHLD